jgi:hypothetical protein
MSATDDSKVLSASDHTRGGPTCSRQTNANDLAFAKHRRIEH